MDDPVWDATVFTKNRQRLLDGEIAGAFLERIVGQARQRGLLSGEHFTVNGTLIEAWASLKSVYLRRGGLQPGANPQPHGAAHMTTRGGIAATPPQPGIPLRIQPSVSPFWSLTMNHRAVPARFSASC